MTTISANGVEGYLIRCVDGRYRFRVYKKANFDFIDYDFLHSDLCVTIADKDATFYSDDYGDRLDHNQQTLGYEK